VGVFCTRGVCVSGLSFSFVSTQRWGFFFLFCGVFYVSFKFLPEFLKSFSNFL
jgi:hypothetical protein